MRRPRPDWFLIGMALMVLLAWQFPNPGARGGWLHPELLTKAGVALIFFLHGVALSFANLRAGAGRWPVHLLVQLTTFGLFPIIGIALYSASGRWGGASDELRIGLFFLCALPSTVSSSVALTAAARGNVAVAVFNATLSGLLGIVLTPLWVSVILHTTGEGPQLGKVVLELVLTLLLPLMLGQLARPWLGGWAGRNKKRIGLVDRATILLLVYTSFCDSFAENVWSASGPAAVGLTVAMSGALFFVVFATVSAFARAGGFNREDRIAAVFCGSKKTLASGVPMAQVLFAGHPGLGVMLLPLMIYHPLQLLICGVLAGRWAREAETKNATQ